MKPSSRFAGIDWLLILPSIYLMVIGFVVLRSLANAGNEDVSLVTQGISMGVGVVLFFLLQRISTGVFLRLAPFIYGAGIILLLAVLAFGSTAQGAERWIEIGGGIRFQPSEVAKLGLILVIARILAMRRDSINRPLSFLVVGVYTAIPALLVLIQPDLGTAITLIVIWLAMLAISRLRKTTFVMLIAAMLLVAVASTPFLASYQQDRLTSFLSPAADPLGTGYNVLQSTIAIGSGGLFGKGLDAGSQSQYNFLPSAHTDFVFAVTAEKLGIIGALSVLIAFLLIILRTLMISWSSPTEFGRYIGVGVAVILLIQTVVNIGMNLGIMPVTGLPLPLMSFGGTHIIAELSLLGILVGVGKNKA